VHGAHTVGPRFLAGTRGTPYLRHVFTTVTLSDRRTLEYADLGDPSGTPVLFFHGTPATGGQAAVIADAAGRHGVRLLAPTRPGYGASTNSPPGLAPTAADTLELADQVGLTRFGVLGASGGGPFALAVAAAAPDRVGPVAVTGGPGVYADVKPEVLEDDDRRALALLAEGDVEEAVRIMTELGDAFLSGMRGLSAEEFSAALRKQAPPGGKDWFDEHPDLRASFEGDFQRAITTSDGFARDNLSWLGPWDFDLSAVTAPVQLVYGESDMMAEPIHGEWLHARLPSSDLRVIPGGHGHVTFGTADDVFAAIPRS
jgi:pimeloyl-ACP methyl ester carboxylesterase